MVAASAMRLLRRKPVLDPATKARTDELARQVDEVSERVERLKAAATVITVRARTGKARSS